MAYGPAGIQARTQGLGIAFRSFYGGVLICKTTTITFRLIKKKKKTYRIFVGTFEVPHLTKPIEFDSWLASALRPEFHVKTPWPETMQYLAFAQIFVIQGELRLNKIQTGPLTQKIKRCGDIYSVCGKFLVFRSMLRTHLGWFIRVSHLNDLHNKQVAGFSWAESASTWGFNSTYTTAFKGPPCRI